MFQVGILIVVTIGLAEVTDAKCPFLFKESNMSCYYFGAYTVGSVDRVFQMCSSIGGYLVNINSKAEYNHIVKKLGNEPASYWTGGEWTGQWSWKRINKAGNTTYDIIDPDQYKEYSCQQNTNGNHLNDRPEDNLVLFRSGSPVQSCYRPYNENQSGFRFICEADWEDAE